MIETIFHGDRQILFSAGRQGAQLSGGRQMMLWIWMGDPDRAHFGWLHDSTGLVEVLHLFANRGSVSRFEAVPHQLAAATDPADLRAKVRRLVEALPLPDALPPVHVAPHRRIDHAGELRTLSKR